MNERDKDPSLDPRWDKLARKMMPNKTPEEKKAAKGCVVAALSVGVAAATAVATLRGWT